MRSLCASLPALLLILLALPARAADAPSRRPLAEVERGFWVGTSLGAIHFPSLPGEGGDDGGTGALVGLEAGIDILPTLQIGALVWGQSIGAPVTFDGVTGSARDPKGARGDFQSVYAGASARWSFLQLADANGIDRTFFFVRGMGGKAWSRPQGIVDDGVFFGGGAGVEYFTRLRHFSIGLEIDGLALQTEEGTAVGIAVLPRIAYTF